MTNAEVAILGLVAEGPHHGYEIESVIQERGMRNWTEVGFSSIYYVLNRLEDAGLVGSHLEQRGRGPARKVYQITEAGLTALRQAVADLLSVPRRRPMDLDLGIANLSLLPAGQVRASLGAYRAAMEARIEALETLWEEKGRGHLPYHVEALFAHPLAVAQAERDWVETFLAQLPEE
jgi:DNA-binding PadR family transcriptional regulator